MEKKWKILFVLSAILVAIILILSIIENSQEKISEPEYTINMTKEEKAEYEEEIDELKDLTEKERIKRYFAKYLYYVEYEEYEKAYSILSSEFKQNYFKTIEEYIDYVKKLYPVTIIVKYDEMERQGKYFVLDMTIQDPIGSKSSFEQKFIVYEKDYNNFVLSFEVI